MWVTKNAMSGSFADNPPASVNTNTAVVTTSYTPDIAATPGTAATPSSPAIPNLVSLPNEPAGELPLDDSRYYKH